MCIFRIAAEEDVPLLEKLAQEIWHLHYPSIISVEQIIYMLDIQYNRNVIADSLKSGKLWVIIVDGDIEVGFMSFDMPSIDICKLEKLYIYPSHQGKGIGRRAIQFGIEYAKKNSAKKIILNVNRKNASSIAAYKAFGFRISHQEDNYLGEYLLDDYVMTLKV